MRWGGVLSHLAFEGGPLVIADEEGARYELTLEGVRAAVHPSARRARSTSALGAEWVVARGDLVEVRGRVNVEAPSAGYRSATRMLTRLRAAEPSSVRMKLRVRDTDG